ncbi:SPEF1 [Bugula neritina]|uniref:SPEF1 n=1 Tax=Bugula neritina TaxID=10212 RepID=A0A7J7JBQ7_BUGNE|nr:SPEF1 [Bugula neritina]
MTVSVSGTVAIAHWCYSYNQPIMSKPPQTTSTSFADEIDDAVLQELYSWVDQIPLSRPKKNLTRDFSDGVLVAETISHYFPKLVELHNYPPATGTKLKMENWNVLNRKVFKKLHFELAEDVIKQVVNAKPFVIERVLLMLRTKIDTIVWEKHKQQNEQPEADQYKQGNSSFLSYRGKESINRVPSCQSWGGVQKPPFSDVSSRNAGDGIVPSDFVPRVQLEEKVQECLSKEETIQILEAKVRRLEHLLHLKDIRINDLQIRVDGIRPTGHR